MSFYGLIKASSAAIRSDTISDWRTVNCYRESKGLKAIVPNGPSIRQLENAVALGIPDYNAEDLPSLIRSANYYKGIIPEISAKDISAFKKRNQ